MSWPPVKLTHATASDAAPDVTLVQALELLVRLLCFGSAVSLASQAFDSHALARQRCFLSRRRRLEQSYPRGKWVVFASLVVSLRTI